MRTNLKQFVPKPRFTRMRGGVRRQRGFVLVAILVLLSVSLTLFGLWSRAVVREHSSLATQQFRLQAGELAEAGLKRAILQRAANVNFTEEVWSVPASELDNTHAAQVRIRVAPTSNSGAIRYEATAEYPVGNLHRVQITKSVEIPNPVPLKKT
jgi:Tfp pilus assembly protein PilX